MNTIITWFATNRVAANLLMLLIVVGGAVTIPGIKLEIFPELSSDRIAVTVEYAGASPDEIEASICTRIEESVYGLKGIKRIMSEAREGLGTVTVQAVSTDDDARRRLLEDIKTRVDSIRTFPEEAERPVVKEFQPNLQVLNIAAWGDTDEQGLRELAEQVRDELSQLEAISVVELANARPREISIEVSEHTLRRHRLTLGEIAAAIRRSSLDLPGGSVKTAGGEVLVRTRGQAYEGREFEELSILTRGDGTRILLGDIATVKDGFADTDQYAWFDDRPALLVQVFRVGEQDALDIAHAVQRYIRTKQASLPSGLNLTVWQDESKILADRLDLMVRNGRMGLLFVFVCLSLFLRLKLALWVAVGIPISFLGAFWMLPLLGLSINLISLFAFIIVLGIVVDDAIVVCENIYSHAQRGTPGESAAIRGTKEVATPVTFAILTTIAAFMPLLFVPGRYGEIMRVIPLIVISTLVFSLIESLFILPKHLQHIRKEPEASDRSRTTLSEGLFGRTIGNAYGFWLRIQDGFTAAMQATISKFYRPILSASIRARYLTLSIAVAAIIATTGFVAGHWIKFEFFPPVDADNVVAFLTMPEGTPLASTKTSLHYIENAARELRKELARDHADEFTDPFQHILTSIGSQPFRETQNKKQGQFETFSGSHLAEVNIELIPSEARSISSKEIEILWRNKIAAIPHAEELLISSSVFSSGEAVNVELSALDNEELLEIANRLKTELAKFAGVIDIADNHRPGKRELELSITPAAESLGLSQENLARQVRQAFYGEEAQRIQRRRDDIKVMVRYPEEERRSLSNIESMMIRTPAGDEVPFATVARARLGRGYSTIHRADRERVITVTAGVDNKIASENEINEKLLNDILPALAEEYPSLTYRFEGDQRDRRDAMRALSAGMLLALVLIYALLAIPFGSYLQPLIVMSAIPFGVVGAIWGHVLMNVDVTFLSLFGIVALTGVIVNDSLVMVDFINRQRRSGTPLLQAVRESGAARFRPIILTSLTTFVGLCPLLFERSLQAQFIIPMAVSLGFGVLFATIVTLIIVPIEYYIIEDVVAWYKRSPVERLPEPGGGVEPISEPGQNS